MFKFMTGFLTDVVKESLQYILDKISMLLLAQIFNPTESINGINFDTINTYIIGVGISYCCFKFARKLLNTYILWTDEDADNPINILVINFIKSIAVILSFDVIYSTFVDIMTEIGEHFITDISSTATGSQDAIEALMPSDIGFIAILVILIAIIMYLISYISCLQTAVLLLILKTGFPLVASGLMDSNGGMFSTYIQKFLQLAFTGIIKLTLLKLSLVLLLNNNPLWCIIILTVGGKVAEMLKEFMLVPNGGLGGKISSGLMALSNIKRLMGK